MTFKKVESGLLGVNNSVFIAFYTDNHLHYQRHPDGEKLGSTPGAAWRLEIPLIGVMVRYNSVFGFVGGKVDDSETLIEAATRECYEEVNYHILPEDLSLFCSHQSINRINDHFHLFLCKVSPDEIYNIRKLSCDAEHGELECAAFAVTHITEEAPDILINSHQWAGSGREEIALLLDFIHQK